MEGNVIQPFPAVQQNALVNSMDKYKEMYDKSLKDPEVRGCPGA